MANIAHTIAVVDKSGKVVSTGKQLRNVFMEAKYAYMERKAEIVAERRAKTTRSGSHREKDLRKTVAGLHIEDAPSEASERSHQSRRPSQRGHHDSHRDSHRHSRREGLERHNSESTVRRRRNSSSPTSPRSPTSRHSNSPRLSNDSRHDRSEPSSPLEDDRRHSLSLARRRTDLDLAPRSPKLNRTASGTPIDMDLAYGEYHPDSIAPVSNEKELDGLVSKAKMLLDEANCAQHSVKAIIEHLQKNPDAMAAVALTLAEISNVAAKMAPGALAALKGSAPAVFALLASPQFLVAVGVGIGVTVVTLGGYKIIKKIKSRAAAKSGNDAQSMDEMIDVNNDEFSRINTWRRGIEASDNPNAPNADLLSESGTSVEGEFITPLAASMRGMETRENLNQNPLSEREKRKHDKKTAKQIDKDLKKSIKAAGAGAKDKAKDKSKDKGKGKEREKDGVASETASTAASRATKSSHKSSRTASTVGTEEGKRALVKVSKPSPLRRLLA